MGSTCNITLHKNSVCLLKVLPYPFYRLKTQTVNKKQTCRLQKFSLLYLRCLLQPIKQLECITHYEREKKTSPRVNLQVVGDRSPIGVTVRHRNISREDFSP